MVGLLAFVLVAPVVLAGAFLLEEHVRGRISLAHYRRALVARGEKLTPRALEADRPCGENGAPEIMAASAELIKGEVVPDHSPPRMKLTASGRAVAGFREKEWVEGDVTYRWDQLGIELETNEPVLRRLRVALQKPVLDNQLDLSQGALARFTHLARMKRLSQWFGARAQLELHDGELHEAVDDLVAQIELVRALARDGIVISELVRVAIASIARTGTWEALQADGWSDADLARLQQAWEDQHFADGMIGGYEGELVFADVSYQQCRASNHWTFQMLFGLEDYGEESDRSLWERAFRQVAHGAAVADFLKEQVYCPIWRFAWLDQNERHYLEEMEDLLTITRTAAAKKSGLEQEYLRPIALSQDQFHPFIVALRNPGHAGGNREINGTLCDCSQTLCLPAWGCSSGAGFAHTRLSCVCADGLYGQQTAEVSSQRRRQFCSLFRGRK